MKDRSDDPSHHERRLLPWSYISLLDYINERYHIWCITTYIVLLSVKNKEHTHTQKCFLPSQEQKICIFHGCRNREVGWGGVARVPHPMSGCYSPHNFVLIFLLIRQCPPNHLVMSGHVRSEDLTCTFRASCCSARLSRAQVQNKGGGGEWVYRIVQAVRGWFEVLWNLERPVGLSQKRNICGFQ